MSDGGRRTVRVAQALLAAAALALWGASRLPWVAITTFDGLGQPRTTTLSGGSWSTALLPLALLLLAAAVAGLAVRGWSLRLLSLLVAVTSAVAGYLAISQWVVPDVSVRAADLAGMPVMFLVGSERYYVGAALTVAAAVAALCAAVLLMRAAARVGGGSDKYAAPAARRAAARPPTADVPAEQTGTSERQLWDALDGGHDPTAEGPAAGPGPDAEGR